MSVACGGQEWYFNLLLFVVRTFLDIAILVGYFYKYIGSENSENAVR